MKICIFTSMIYPVPAIRGGAVEGLIELLINENEKYKRLKITVISIYDEKAKELSKQYKHTNFIYIKTRGISDKFWSKKIFLYLNKILIKLNGKTIISMPFLKKAWKQIKNDDFDRYIVEGGGDNYNFGFLMNRISKEKLYIHYHGEVSGNNYLNNMFGKHITVSNYIARKLISNGIIELERVAVLPNCYDAETLMTTEERDYTRKKLGIGKEEFVFVYWGRLLPEKGVLELIEAFELVSEEKLNVRLLVIGNATFGNPSFTKYNEKLEALVKQKIKNNKVIFTGFISHSQIGNILSAADVGVIPSIWDDPAPLAVFEGLSKGLPLIVTKVGGIPEIIENRKNGLIVSWSMDYIKTLAKAMNELMENDDLRKELSRNALSTIKCYGPSVYYNNYINVVTG